MVDSKTIRNAANLAGLQCQYTNAWGSETEVSDGQLLKLLESLGYDTRDDETLAAAVARKHKKPVLDSVLVLKQSDAMDIRLNSGKSARIGDFSWKLSLENGEIIEGTLEANLKEDRRENDGTVVFRLLEQSLPAGYHTLEVSRKRRKTPYRARLVVTPGVCYKQPSLENGKKLWGTTIQLYSLKTDHNWGIGDFGDLRQLIGDIGNRGGSFVGLNPIHSLFPANPEGASPYSPSSRRWLNVLYIDVTAVPEFPLSEDALQMVGAEEFQGRLQRVRETSWVNYSEVACLKLSVLPVLYRTFVERHKGNKSERAAAFESFIESGGESLLQQATFDALHAELKATDDSVWGYPAFPAHYKRFNSPAVQSFIRKNHDAVEYYMYLQWLADEQLAEVQAYACKKGMDMGLYRDLAVGVCDGGSEVWADDGVLCEEAGIGAPPDILGPQGQSWGLPPMDPGVLRERGYQPFIDLLRANMAHCGALRIDHILGLLRLWWIPKGDSASDGAYLSYPVDDLLGILSLESHRNRCSVIGEDLGTVPEEITQRLLEAGVHSYKVFFFETATDGGYISPAHYTSQSLSTLCTHDMPTLRGFWHCDDLRLGQEIGIYPDQQQLQVLFDERAKNKQRMLDSIAWHGHLPEGVGRDAMFVPMDWYLAEGMQLHLAAGSSALLGLQLEDWLEMDKPVNIPGTVEEYPNWRRKLSVTLDEMFAREEINTLCKRLTETRTRASNME